ncbi:MAG: 1-deoxy-D-xylulose-5-phosphate synthase [Lachnospiraceae bacterium]|nr:1-deoxy-D-xylulose-5-phosphate synthase [Lachnospiraceae bacterium]
MGELLEQIKQPNDIKDIKVTDYKTLAREIRQFLVQKISHTGGHLASNLGAVELTMALHLCCDFPHDQIVWDVGHQCYTHKILTGRQDGFDHLRQFGGMSGFPKREESDCDAFDTGHSSTSIGIALGLAKARDIKGENHKVFAVLGDGALSGGMAYEALNNAARLKSNLIIVINDNQMSISKNVGGMSNYLGKIRTSGNYTGLKEDIEKALSKMPGLGDRVAEKIRGIKDLVKRLFIPGMLFEDMGLTYIGPIDGHNIGQMVTAFQNASKMNEAVIVHVCTKKGKGYRPAEKDPSHFHGVSPFHIKDGSSRWKEKSKRTYTDIFSETILKLAAENECITAVSAAMPEGTGLSRMAEEYPERFFDVGIAEEHAVTFAAGMAAGGLRPVVALYSTFLQRAYDQMVHDVCIGNLPVVFAVDRAGLVGSDGETHQGIFDIAFMRSMPNLTVMAPKNGWELEQMLSFALKQQGPVALRYPRGTAWEGLSEYTQPIDMGKSEWLCQEGPIALLAVGSMVETAMEVRHLLENRGIRISVVNVRFVKPMDEELLEQLLGQHRMVVTLEEGVAAGGFGEGIAAWYEGKEMTVHQITLPDQFIEHGSVKELKKKYGLDGESITEKIMMWKEECI